MAGFVEKIHEFSLREFSLHTYPPVISIPTTSTPYQHNIDTPYRVVINEAIELAKGYGGTDGHKFINGVLDKLAPRLRPTEVDAARAARS